MNRKRVRRGPIRLTDRSVRSLKAESGRRAVRFDSIAPGLAVRCTDTGAKSFYFVYRSGARIKWFRIGDAADLSLADARDKVGTLRADRIHGVDPVERKKKALAAQTFGELADAFVDELRADKKKSWRNYHRVLIGGPLPDAKRALKRKKKSPHVPLSQVWGDRKLAEIKRGDVRDVIESIKRRAPIHANRTFAYIRQAFNFALDREWIDSNPCAGIHKRIRSEEKERHRVLSEGEIRTLWTALDGESQIIADVVRVLLLTWQRSGEVFRMRWDELSSDGWWELPETRTKNGLPHRVYLTKGVRDILDHRLADQRRGKYADSEWVFRSPKRPTQAISHITKAIIRLRARTEFDFRPHDLRRTAASLAAKAGVPELTIPKVLGHIPTGVTRKHYNLYAYDAEKRTALELWAREVDRMLKDEKSESRNVVSFFARA
jgi:integrase